MNLLNRDIQEELPFGQTLHHSHVFSADGQWIVFDGRDDDTKIGETSVIGMQHVHSGAVEILYRTVGAAYYGPGVGAASFHPKEGLVVFIHGLSTASAALPYAISRRTAMLVATDRPMVALPADARHMQAPYIAGTLRGGTHSHAWNQDGSMLSFTYNDALVEEDLRHVGVMLQSDMPVQVPQGEGNTWGTYYAALVSQVKAVPTPGSDEISKAFDECWLPQQEGNTSESIAFQGHTRNADGQLITEIFVVDIHKEHITADTQAVGLLGQRPGVPSGIRQRRLSHSQYGLSDLRHWLRCSADGRYIYALAKDEMQRNQLVRCHTADGTMEMLSDFDFSISSAINISYGGDMITFIAHNTVYIYHLDKQSLIPLSRAEDAPQGLVGVPVFSRDDSRIAYNYYIEQAGTKRVRIKVVELN